ncbi:cache domain-containing protein [Sulfurospirillum sp. 1307]
MDNLQEEKNIKRVILLGSTFIILSISIGLAFLLISSEIKNFKTHLETFKKTLIEREKFTLKSRAENIENDILYENVSSIKQLKQITKNQTIIAYNIAKSIYSNNQSLSQDEVIRKIRNALYSIGNHKIQYFIFDVFGNLILNTSDRSSESRNYLDFEDIYGFKYVKEIISTKSKTGNFVSFTWYKPKSSKISKKITFVKMMDELGIIVGSASFLDDINQPNDNIIEKIKRQSFRKDEFMFMYKINSLNNAHKNADLIIQKNLKNKDKIPAIIEKILISSDYKANIFFRHQNSLFYSKYIKSSKIFISVGLDLGFINEIIAEEEKISNKNLMDKITTIIIIIVLSTTLFFAISYFVSSKIERIFKDYRQRVTKQKQLLIQKSKMASMGEMIANIAHQWRQPLSQLSGLFFDIEMAHEYKELDKKYLSNRIDEANDLVEYMSKTIDDFKEFYNPNTKKENFSLLESVNNALKVVDASLRYSNIIVEVDIDESLHVRGYKNEFSQVILNIISNSKDIAKKRDIKEPIIKIYAKKTDKKIVLHVEDNCGGIEDENFEKIFEPYFTTKYDYGTGIGLYMSKVIVENKMNGKIIASNTSFGALFKIVLVN